MVRLVLRLQRSGSGILKSFYGHIDEKLCSRKLTCGTDILLLWHESSCKVNKGPIQRSNVPTISIVEMASIEEALVHRAIIRVRVSTVCVSAANVR